MHTPPEPSAVNFLSTPNVIFHSSWLALAFFAGMLWASCAENRPDEPTRKRVFQELKAAEKNAEALAFAFIQDAENPHDVANVERYRQIRKDSATVAWKRILEKEGWGPAWADSIWTEGIEKGWSVAN